MLVVWGVLACLLIYWCIQFTRRNTKAPPGPRPWPLLGNIVHLARATPKVNLVFAHFAKIYGDIYSIKIGLKDTVVITSKEAIDTIFSNAAVQGRECTGPWADRCGGKNLGVGFANGVQWDKTRTWTFKQLKDFGFGKSAAMEHYIQGATETLFSHIDKTMAENGGKVPVELLFSSSVYTIIWQMFVGPLTPKDWPSIHLLGKKSQAVFSLGLFGAGAMHAFPFLRFICPKAVGYNGFMEVFKVCNVLGKELLSSVRAKWTKVDLMTRQPETFMEAFVQKMEQEETEIFCEENFRILFQDIILGSTHTTSSYLEGVVLFLTLYPDAQAKVYNEILEHSPDGHVLNFSDRKKMAYTQAFLLEVHRHVKIGQGTPRMASKDFTYKQYLIKKGTIILSDLHLLYTDEKLWDEPDEFRPERFINNNGELFNFQNIIPFSVGKRMCPGELYASAVSFLYLTSMLQRYQISVPKGQPRPRQDMQTGMSSRPFYFEACFAKRQMN